MARNGLKHTGILGFSMSKIEQKINMTERVILSTCWEVF